MTAAARDLSMEHRAALLPPDKREELLAGLSDDELAALEWDWAWQGRPSQLIDIKPDDPVAVILALAGRGFGKTLMGAQWIRELDAKWATLGRDTNRLRVALVGRTSADVRDVMLEGPSGLMNIYPPSLRDRVRWTPTRRRVDLPNGAICTCFSADEPSQLRGPQFHIGWSDELAAYKQVRSSEDDATAWDNLRIAVRLGARPQILATTTPKRVPVLRSLLAEQSREPSKFLLRRGRTRDNRYLSKPYLDVLEGMYGGTALGRQELEGEMLDDVAGAMTSEAIIERFRVKKLPPSIPWIKVVSVDPSVAERPHDECGIVVIYISRTWPILKRHAFVVDDLSLRASPTSWGEVALRAANQHDAFIVTEVNQGANLVFQMLRQTAEATGLPLPAIREVWSSKSKAVRAEPVGGAYARGRVHHVNVHADLESQCFPADTLVETRRGHVPIASITTDDQVMTRAGWAPLARAGQSGVTDQLRHTIHATGCVLSTPWHQFWTFDRGFVSAANVRPSDHLLVRPSPANTAFLSHGAGIGGTRCPRRVTSADDWSRSQPPHYSCTGQCGSFTAADHSPPNSPSIIGTSSRGTTGSRTSNSSTLIVSTCDCTTEMAAAFVPGPLSSGSITQGRAGSIARRAWWPAPVAGKCSSRPVPGRSGAPAAATPQLDTSRCRCSNCSATGAGSRSLAAQQEQSGVRSHVVDGQDMRSGGSVPVYDLTVADGYLPEFFADGVLVHNCTSWVYGEAGYSPDRMDAAVQGLAAGLFPEASANGMPGSSVIRTVAEQNLGLAPASILERAAMGGFGGWPSELERR